MNFSNLKVPQPQSNIPINPQQFTQLFQSMNKARLQQIVRQAQLQGISQSDIEAGLNALSTLIKK